MKLSRNRKGILLALCSVFLWSTVASAFKISLSYFSPLQLLFFADLTSIVLLCSFLSFQSRFTELYSVEKSQWFTSLKYGFLNPFLYYLILLYAYDMLPAQQAQAINYTWAIALTLLAVPLLKQRVNRFQITAIAISYFGVVIICTKGSFNIFFLESFLGVVLALISTIIWAFYWIVNTKDTREPVIGLLMNFLCALPMICVGLFFENLLHGLNEISIQGLLGSLYVGFFEMGIAFVCWLYAMKMAKSTASIANLIFLAPVLSLVLIYYLVGEIIHPSTFFGLAVILIGLFLQTKATPTK